MYRLSRKFFAPCRFICAWQQAPRLYPHFVGETRNDSEYKRGRSYARRTHASLPRFYALPPYEKRDLTTSDALRVRCAVVSGLVFVISIGVLQRRGEVKSSHTLTNSFFQRSSSQAILKFLGRLDTLPCGPKENYGFQLWGCHFQE